MSIGSLLSLTVLYGALCGYVLTRATRNRGRGRRNSMAVEWLGWLLCGVSATLAVAMAGWVVLLALGSTAVPAIG